MGYDLGHRSSLLASLAKGTKRFLSSVLQMGNKEVGGKPRQVQGVPQQGSVVGRELLSRAVG